MKLPLLDTELLLAFVTVDEHRSFTRAAAVLHRTQPAVSMQIKRLEICVGAVLFDRTGSRLELTGAGERLLGPARRMLDTSDRAVGQIRQQAISERVRLGIMEDYGTRVVPALLATFAIGQPCVRVDMETGLTSRMLTRLGRDFDLVVAMHREGTGGGEFLRRETPVWAAGAAPVERRAGPLELALYPPGCLFRAWAIEALEAAARPWRLGFVSQSILAVEAISAQGFAVTVVKPSTCPKSLRQLSERDGMPRLPAADIRMHRAERLSSAAALLAEHLRDGLSARA